MYSIVALPLFFSFLKGADFREKEHRPHRRLRRRIPDRSGVVRSLSSVLHDLNGDGAVTATDVFFSLATYLYTVDVTYI